MARSPNRKKRFDFYHLDIPEKANRILHFILIVMFLFLMRIWYLSIIQYDQKLEESQKPQRKTIITPATRATIRDRFNLPLAINKISYQATILYSQLRDIPSIEWQKDENGNKIKVFKRKNYIRNLSEILAFELGLDADRVEDLIHSKASYYSQVPFVIKEDLSEDEYYRLKALENEWPGIHTRHLPKRFYPYGRTAADVVGYMGAINKVEYEKVLHEMKALELFIQKSENDEEIDLPQGIETLDQARARLRYLQAKAYTIHDYIGKTGLEGVFEEQLRGFYGKKIFYSDSKGNFLEELPGARPPLSGQRILSTISIELQEYAEELLAQNEELRMVLKSRLGPVKKTVPAKKDPWIKGGGIVVMEPYTGEILTLASFPRFDPNDFIMSGDEEQKRERKNQINRWFENDTFIAQVWNQQQPLRREKFNKKEKSFFEEERWMNWQSYLDIILPSDNVIHQTFSQIHSLSEAIVIQRKIDQLMNLFPEYDLYTLFNFMYLGDQHEQYQQNLKGNDKLEIQKLMKDKQSEVLSIRSDLKPYLEHITHNYDKVLLVDLCRLVVCEGCFNSDLLSSVGHFNLNEYRDQESSLVSLTNFVRLIIKEHFHDVYFKEWRQKNEKEFLKNKRAEEKLAKTYAKPYLDYLDQQENIFFKDFWEEYKWNFMIVFLLGKNSIEILKSDSSEIDILPYYDYLNQWYLELDQGAHQNAGWKKSYDKVRNALLLLTPQQSLNYLKAMRSYEDLNRPLFGRYRYLRKGTHRIEKNLAAAFYPIYGYGCGRSHAYRQSAIQGSLFKLVTGYEALIQQYNKKKGRILSLSDLNPLIMIDEVFHQGKVRYVGYTEDGKPIPQLYKGARLPRSLAHKHNGKVDFLRALEVSSNPYFSLLAGECLERPEDLSDAARLFSFGEKTGIDLPYEIAGKVPTDLATNRTGLYAMAIGQHSLVVTPLQTAVMLAAIANGGKVLKPKLVKLTVGRQSLPGDDQIVCPPYFPYQDSLSLIGIDFPLFSALSSTQQQSLIKNIPTEVKREIPMPQAVRQILLKGLKAASLRTHQENLESLSRLYKKHPEAIQQFSEFKDQLLGKTSTSESVENIDLDLQEGTNIYTHVWFGSIAFEDMTKDKHKTILLLKDEFGKPELIIVVYLRYGGYGKEAAPIAAQLLKKWRELKEKYAEGPYQHC